MQQTRSILHVIENLHTGGAQRTVELLCRTPGLQSTCMWYRELSSDTFVGEFDALVLHVWRRARNSARMNWPHHVKGRFDKRVVFNHDWCGFLNAGAEAYLVYSEFARSHSIADAPVVVLPAGIDISEFAKIQRAVGTASGLVVGRLSTMWASKIDATVLRFWPSLPAVKFLVGGAGPMRAGLINEFGSDSRFHFPGEIARVDVPGFLQSIDVFLYDTPWHVESFCYVTLEAMAAGCVVVARRKGAIPDQISDGETGFLYDTAEQAIDIIRHLDANRLLMSSIGARAREVACRRYPLAEFQSRFLTALGWA